MSDVEDGAANGGPTVDQGFLDIPEAANPCQCRYCGKILTRVFYRKEHERIHTGEKPFQCNYCEKRFNSQGSCRKHERRHGKFKRGFECDHCGRKFYDYRYYKSHMRTHLGEKPYSCHICNRSFGIENVLKKHMLIHNEQNQQPSQAQQYRCSLCPSTFSSTQELKEHTQTHASQRLHKCHYCNLRFSSEKRRNIHEKSHEKSAVHQCGECGAVFQSANLLATHEARSEVAGGCDLLTTQDDNENAANTTANGTEGCRIEIGYMAQSFANSVNSNQAQYSDIGILNGHATEEEEANIYPTGLLRSTDRGIKQEPMSEMTSYDNTAPNENGVESSNQSVYSDEGQRYILSPEPPLTGSLLAVACDESATQTDPVCDVDSLYAQLEATGQVHECKSCQIIFRNYTMYLVHKTLHANQSRPFACHLCDHESKDNVDFNAHLIWHMK